MLQNFISSPWQNLEKQSFNHQTTDSSSWLDPSKNHIFQTPSRHRLMSESMSSQDNQHHKRSNSSINRQNLFSHPHLTGSVSSQSNNEKCTDRFIPQVKMPSNYYSLLLTESRNSWSKRDKLSGSTLLSNEHGVQNESGHNSNDINGFQSQGDAGYNVSHQEDTYTELLRNNIIKEISDYQNRQPSTSRNSLFADAKKHSSSSSSSSFNNKIIDNESSSSRKTPKVFSYKMNIHRKNQLIQEADDIIFTQEPVENRKISSKPYKILDAPSLSGDFYTNVLDWTRQNLVVVALNNQVYTWSPVRHDVNNLMANNPTQSNIISLSSNRDGQMLGVADESGSVKIFDLEKSKILYEYEAHTDRIGAIAWNDNLLTTASKDFLIKIRDVRSKQNICSLNFHKEQVCGIKWSEDGMNLASGGNDNKVCVYNWKMNKLTSVFKSHNGAVKALAWSPHKQNVLVSGGGNKDQTLKFWNTQTNTLIKSIHTGSQVCNMVFSKNHNEIVTTHGFQLNQVSVWSADNYSQIVTLYGHTERVLYLAISPDQEDIVTGSADETLRFWKVFNQKKKREQSSGQSKLDPIFSSLR